MNMNPDTRDFAESHLSGITRAQRRALVELAAGEFTRGLAILDAKRRVAKLTLAAKPVVEMLNEART